MITKIFKNLEEFQKHLKNNPDDNCNGCTQDFLDEHNVTLEDYEKMNESNSKCWNCWDCNNCIDCYGIKKEAGIENSISLKEEKYIFTDKEIISFKFKNELKEVDGWIDMVKKLIQTLYNKENKKSIDFENYPYSMLFKGHGEKKYIIEDTPIYLRQGYGAEYIVKSLRHLFTTAEISHDSLYFTLDANDNSDYSIKYSDFVDDDLLKDTINVLILSINKSFDDTIKNKDKRQEAIFNATHKSWSVSLSRANSLNYIFSVYNGKIIEIFKPNPIWNWELVNPKDKRKEYQFLDGIPLDEDDDIKRKYLNRKVKARSQSGMRYFDDVKRIELYKSNRDKGEEQLKSNNSSDEPLQENQNEATIIEKSNAPEIGKPRNRIVFGAPGTGKSYRLEQDRKDVKDADGKVTKKRFDKDDLYERVTFHPNYSYSNFVGTYKPVSDGDNIKYKYVPGPFLRILIKALKNKNENYLLLIEEINRANVAAVFGDVFQLLDRKDNSSEYPIDLSEDIKRYLHEIIEARPNDENDKQVKNLQDIVDKGKLYIPTNMYIWATMNSADQGVFPMDTAFKRRWDFEYIGINDAVENDKKEKMNNKDTKSVDFDKLKIPIPTKDDYKNVYWNDLRNHINEQLIENKINEDKLLGPFFLSKSVLEDINKDVENYKKIIDEYDNSESDDKKKETLKNKEELENKMDKFIKLFESKVIMYLFEDVVRVHRDKIFNNCDKMIFSDICKNFEEGNSIFKNIDIASLIVDNKITTVGNTDESDDSQSE